MLAYSSQRRRRPARSGRCCPASRRPLVPLHELARWRTAAMATAGPTGSRSSPRAGPGLCGDRTYARPARQLGRRAPGARRRRSSSTAPTARPPTARSATPRGVVAMRSPERHRSLSVPPRGASLGLFTVPRNSLRRPLGHEQSILRDEPAGTDAPRSVALRQQALRRADDRSDHPAALVAAGAARRRGSAGGSSRRAAVATAAVRRRTLRPPSTAPEPEPPSPAGPPRFESRALWTPKRGNDDKEWEDGYAIRCRPAACVAVADGAGDGIFSKLWADLLLESFVATADAARRSGGGRALDSGAAPGVVRGDPVSRAALVDPGEDRPIVRRRDVPRLAARPGRGRGRPAPRPPSAGRPGRSATSACSTFATGN